MPSFTDPAEGTIRTAAPVHVGPGPVGQHHEVGDGRLCPFDEGADTRQRRDPAGGARRRIRFVTDHPHAGAVGDDGQGAAQPMARSSNPRPRFTSCPTPRCRKWRLRGGRTSANPRC